MDAELNQFYQHLTAERGLAPLTVSAYASDLQDFWQFAESRELTEWGAVSLAHLQDYLAALEGRGLSARSRARKLSALRQFYRFLQREEKVKANPVELLDSPRLPQRLPKVLGEDEVAALLNGPDPATPLGQRDGALLELLVRHRAEGLGAGGPDPETAGPAPGGGAPPGQGLQGAGGAHGGGGGGKDRALPGPGPRPSS